VKEDAVTAIEAAGTTSQEDGCHPGPFVQESREGHVSNRRESNQRNPFDSERENDDRNVVKSRLYYGGKKVKAPFTSTRPPGTEME